MLVLASFGGILLAFAAASSAQSPAPVSEASGPALHFGDFDADALPDVYVVRPGAGDRLYRNLGDGTFVDVSEKAGLAGISGSLLAIWRDFDGDGWLDLYVSAADGRSRMLRNERDASFSDVTAGSGLEQRAGSELFAESFDFDLDGRPDLRVVRERSDELYRNVGDARFERVELGMLEESLATGVIAMPLPGAPLAGAATAPSLHADRATNSTREHVDRTGAGPSALASRSPVHAPGAGRAFPRAPDSPAASTLGVTTCVKAVNDKAMLGSCIEASSVPEIGTLYPLSTDLNVGGTGNVGIGTTSPAQKLEVTGNVRASGQLMSTVATGTSPLSLSSTTKVTNLNADQLDGIDSSGFSQLGSSIESAEITNGTIANTDVSGSAAIAGTKVSPNFGSQAIVSSGTVSVQGWRTFDTGNTPNVVGGRVENQVLDSAFAATIGGGGGISNPNEVADHYCTVAGGSNNTAGLPDGDSNASHSATVSGGASNQATAAGATVCGGATNIASGLVATVGGGLENQATGAYSCVPGGRDNSAAGSSSIACGTEARASHDGSFVWADSNNGSPSVFVSTGIDQFLIRAAGGVGIGTTSPEGPLHVLESSAGSVTANASSIAVLERANGGWLSILSGDGDSKGVLFGNASDPDSGGIVYDQASVASESMQFRTGGNATRMLIDSAGNVGIGTSAPAFLLHVDGSAGKPGGGSWSVASDARLKTNVRELDGALARLLRLRGVTFEYLDPEAIGELAGERTGFLAQEVEQVFPDWVEEGPDGYKRLSVRGFEALAVEALRELRIETGEALSRLSSEREAEIAELRAEMTELRAMVAPALDPGK